MNKTLPPQILNQARHQKQPRFAPSALAFAIASSLVPMVHAQESYSTTGPEEIEVTSYPLRKEASSLRFTRPVLDTAQTINIVPRELIEQRGATNLRDVLRNVSGISMQAGEGGTPAGDQLSIRGYSARTDIFVDNVRDFGGYTRDPFNLEQVEVVKGPSSDYSGRGSTGGSINMVSKSPRLADTTSVIGGIGTDSFQRLTADINRAIPGTSNTAARLNVLYHDQDTAGRNNINNSRWGIAPSLAFGVEAPTQLTLSLFHLEQDNVPDYGIPWVPASNTILAEYANQPPPVDFSNWYGLKARDFEKLSTDMATAQVDHDFSINFRVNNITRWGQTDRDSMITAPRFLSTDSTDIRRSDEKYRDQEDSIISNQTNFNWNINPGQNWEHRIAFGLDMNKEEEVRYTQVLTGSDSAPTDLFNPTPDDPYLEDYQRTGSFSEAKSASLAVFASDSIQITEHWQVNGGIRWDHFELDYTPDGSNTLSRTDTMTSYRAGLLYKPVAEGSIYAGYGTSFNPTAEALSISTSRRQPGIADLDPEENETVELGIKWEVFNRSTLLSAALFRTDKTNARTQDPDDPNDVLVLKGKQLVQGIELGIAGAINDKISIFAGYTFLDTEIQESLDSEQIGNELSNSPRNSFNLWATYTPTQTLQFGVGTQFVDERFNSTANTRTAPAYTLYEASATWLFSDQFNVRLNLQNLTDEKYIDYVGGGHFVPGLGRVAMLSTNFTF